MSNEVNWALGEIGDQSQNVYGRLGLWPGRVEDIDDPKQLGRIRVRIFHLHGDKRSTSISGLPWAKVLSLGGGGHDYGSAGSQYIVGSTVFVAFEQGDERAPIVLGGIHGSPTQDIEYLTVEGRTYSQVDSAWVPKKGNEIPKDVFGAKGDTHPTITVWRKSYKGHTILVEDRDGFEFLRVIDRAGQVVEMHCPVTKSSNLNNAKQRGTRNSIEDTQLPQSDLVNGRAYIRLKDIAGQEVILDGKANSEEIRLLSRNRQGSTAQQITISSAKGREKIELSDKNGNTVVVDPNSSKSIRVYDTAGNEIYFSSEESVASYTAVSDASETVGRSKLVEVAGKLQERIGGNRDVRISGNSFLSILNDLSASVTGMTSAVLSGAAQLQVVNAPSDGIPKTVGYDVSVAAGDARTTTVLGNNELEATAGNVNAVTTNPIAKVNLGSRLPTDSAALDSKVQTELARISAELKLLRDEVGRARAPVPEIPFPLIFGDILQTFPQPLLYTIPGQAPINIRTGADATPNNAPMDSTTDAGSFVNDPLNPGQSGVFTAPGTPGTTLSERVKIDK